MFNVLGEHLICTLWETLRPAQPFGIAEAGFPRGLVVTLDLSSSYYTDDHEFHRRGLLHTVFTANTSVFTAVSEDFKGWDQISLDAWNNTSNHDSCWRSDGMRTLSELYFRWAKEINEEMVARGYPDLAPREFDGFCTLGSLGNSPWEFVRVGKEQVKPTDDNPHPYKFSLTHLSREVK